ncbi:NAD-dependent epimerase/dehydratase family protein [Ruegeria conchae]|uniref:NAD-dependent epimerase/dehydratase family protein n=1 Tax=Ruegeria conchae TaxID=981384 RepID=UPI0029C94AF5|nr:NAD-dependent epimerase/dehydratase family protein [Ruegeria conchae]
MALQFDIGILGHSGFVGSTLARALPDAHRFNSRTVQNAEGQRFDTLYCAAAPGSMFEANKYPDCDAQRIDALIASLSRMQARRFVLISTIAVLDRFDGGYTETNANYQETVAYGVNRRRLEQACQAHFPQCLIVRLPALFGPGLMKNFIFDLMNPMPTMLNSAAYEKLETQLPASLTPTLGKIYSADDAVGMYVIDRAALAALPDRAELTAEADHVGINAVMFHNCQTTYQFYEMTRLNSDINLALEAGLDVLHLAPEPLMASEVHRALIGRNMPETAGKLHQEDMRTQHAGLFGQNGPYNRSGDDVLAALTSFFSASMEG